MHAFFGGPLTRCYSSYRLILVQQGPTTFTFDLPCLPTFGLLHYHFHESITRLATSRPHLVCSLRTLSGVTSISTCPRSYLDARLKFYFQSFAFRHLVAIRPTPSHILIVSEVPILTASSDQGQVIPSCQNR